MSITLSPRAVSVSVSSLPAPGKLGSGFNRPRFFFHDHCAQAGKHPRNDLVQTLHGYRLLSATGARHAEQKLPDFRSNQPAYGVE